MKNTEPILLFSGSSHPHLAKDIAKELSLSLGKIEIKNFPDGEIGVNILENVRGRETFVIQTIATNPCFYLMEMLIMVDALKRASASSITAVIPYFGFARQDRRNDSRESITAKLIADLLQKAGVSRVLTMDLHSPQIEGFFDIPVDHIHAYPELVKRCKAFLPKEKFVVVAPDIGSIKLAKLFAKQLNVDFAVIDKRRISDNEVEPGALIGDVSSKCVLIVDDICSTGITLKKAAKACHNKGAKQIFAVVTHLLEPSHSFHDDFIQRLLVSDTVHASLSSSSIEIVSVAGIFAKAVQSLVKASSITEMFK